MKIKWSFLGSFMLFNVVLMAQTSYIHCGQLFDGEQMTRQKTVVVYKNTITGIEDGFTPGNDTIKVYDFKESTVLPGLMDMHIHIEHESNPKRYEEGFRENEADVALKASQYCERTLMAGFTTVRDLGGTGVNVSLQKAIARGFIPGPRIFTAEKALATTGGHADPSNGLKKDLMGDPGPKEGVINSPEEARQAVRQRYKNGADCIKITATGGVLSVAKDGQGPQFTIEEVKAVVEAANDYGFVTAAHAHGVEGMKRAIIGGIHSIEHGTKMNEEVMDLMIKHGTYLVPTISAGKFVEEKAKIPGFYPAVIVPKALEIGPLIQETCGKAYRRGVKIAFGTDAGVSRHGDNAREFEFMVEAGIPPLDALKMATKHAADLMRVSDYLGHIKKGYVADIVAVKDDPLDNISTMNEVVFVMKEGVVYKQN